MNLTHFLAVLVVLLNYLFRLFLTVNLTLNKKLIQTQKKCARNLRAHLGSGIYLWIARSYGRHANFDLFWAVILKSEQILVFVKVINLKLFFTINTRRLKLHCPKARRCIITFLFFAILKTCVMTLHVQ